MDSKILEIGCTTSTAGIGGVSIHVERLVRGCVNAFPVDLCDYKEKKILTQLKMIVRHDVIHIHASNPILVVFYVVVSSILHKKTVLTIHGDIGKFGPIKNYLLKLSIKSCDIPITLNDASFNQAINWNKRTLLMSAFIPPNEGGFFPNKTLNIIKAQKEKGLKIVSTNAYKRVFDKAGQEVYGIEFLTNYFSLKEQYILVISDPSAEYKRFFLDTLPSNVILISEPHSFYELLKFSDFMIRNTVTDGDSISIHEALSLKVRVLATDCVNRPSGVSIFKYSDGSSLDKALSSNISGNEGNEQTNTVQELINIYKLLL